MRNRIARGPWAAAALLLSAAALLLLAAALLLLAAPAFAQGPRAGAPAAPVERKLWWNDAGIAEELSLSAEQQAEMDRVYEGFSVERPDPKRRRETQAAFEEALTAGEWAEAEKQLDALARQNAAPLRALGRIKIDILKILSDEQREKLASSHPILLRQAWAPRASWTPPQRQRRARPAR